MSETTEKVTAEDNGAEVVVNNDEVDDVPGVHVQVGRHDAQIQNSPEEGANE